MAKAAEAQVHLTLVDRLSARINRIQARLAALGNRLGFDRISKAASNLGSRIANLGDAIGRTTGRLALFTGLLGVGAGSAAVAAFNLTKHAADLGGELDDTAYKLGIGIEALQEWRYVAMMGGVESETLGKGIEKLGINAASAAGGNKGLAASFKALGVRVKDANGKLKPTETLLTDTMRALGKIKDPIRRNELAFKLFGKSGVAMVQMLNGGADAIEELRAEARRTGHVMSEDAAKAAAEFGDNIDRLQKRIDGLRLMIGVHLLPVMNEVVTAITAWYDANADLVRSTIAAWVKRLTGFIRDLMNPASELRGEIRGLVEWFEKLAERMRPVVDFLGGPMQAGLALVAAWIAGPLVLALATLTAAFVKLGIVILTTPIGWILAGIAAFAAGVYVLYQRWDEFTAYWAGAWDRLVAAFDQGFLQGLYQLFWDFNLVTLVARAVNEVVEYFTGIDLMAEGAALIKSLADGALSMAYEPVKAVDRALYGMWQGYEAGVDAAWNAGAKLASKLWKGFEEIWNGIRDSARAAGEAVVTAIWDGLKSKWDGLRAWLKGAVAELVEWLPESVQTRLGFKKDESPAGKLGERMGGMVKPLAAPTVDAPTVGRMTIDAPPLAPPSLPSAGVPAVETQRVQADTVEAGNVQMPDPILVHEPQQINMPATYNITINAPGADANQIAGAVKSAIAEQDRKRAAEARSALND